jgi:hypothetical protein
VTEGSRFDRAWPSLLALVGTVAVVLGLLWAFGSDIDPDQTADDPVAEDGDLSDDGAADEPAGEDEEAGGESGEGTEPEAPTEDPESPAEPVTAPPDVRTPVGVLNATSVSGLAARAQERFEDGGWSVPAIDSTSREIEATTVYYPSGLEESAEALQAQFPEIARTAPTEPGLAQDRLVVILGDDYAEAVGDT